MGSSLVFVHISLDDSDIKKDMFELQEDSKDRDMLAINTNRGSQFIHMNKKHTEALYKALEAYLYSDKTYSELESDNHRLENQIEELKDQLHENYA